MNQLFYEHLLLYNIYTYRYSYTSKTMVKGRDNMVNLADIKLTAARHVVTEGYTV